MIITNRIRGNDTATLYTRTKKIKEEEKKSSRCASHGWQFTSYRSDGIFFLFLYRLYIPYFILMLTNVGIIMREKKEKKKKRLDESKNEKPRVSR